jgi:hypothetical protein
MVALKVSGCGARYAAARDDDRPAVAQLLAAGADPNALVRVGGKDLIIIQPRIQLLIQLSV